MHPFRLSWGPPARCCCWTQARATPRPLYPLDYCTRKLILMNKGGCQDLADFTPADCSNLDTSLSIGNTALGEGTAVHNFSCNARASGTKWSGLALPAIRALRKCLTKTQLQRELPHTINRLSSRWRLRLMAITQLRACWPLQVDSVAIVDWFGKSAAPCARSEQRRSGFGILGMFCTSPTDKRLVPCRIIFDSSPDCITSSPMQYSSRLLQRSCTEHPMTVARDAYSTLRRIRPPQAMHVGPL